MILVGGGGTYGEVGANKKDRPKPKTSNVDYDRHLDREQRDPREAPDEFVTDAEIEAREVERRRREGGQDPD